MADSFRNQPSSTGAGGARGGEAPPPAPPLPPPPAPPLPPQRYANRATSALARFAQPFFYGSRPPSPQPTLPQEPTASPAPPRRSISGVSSPPTISHPTGIPIAALDISPQRTHAVIAGREILRTIKVTQDKCTEEFDLRAAVVNYATVHHASSTGGGLAARHKDQLAAKDVKWSHAEYDRVIATAAANGRIVVYDLTRPGLELGRFQEHSRQVHRLAFNPHRAAWLLSGSQDATARMWDLRMLSGERGVMTFGSKHRFSGHSEAVRDIRWSPVDGVEFATATDSGAIQRWDVRKESAPLLRINAHEKPCCAVDWHPDGKHIVSGSVDKQVKVWDFSSADRRQKPAFQFRAPQPVSNVRWRPPSWSAETQDKGDWQSAQLVTSYEQEDPRVHLWDLRRPHIPYREFDYHNRPATDMLWRSDDLLWVVNGEGAFTQTDLNIAPQVTRRRQACSIAWSPDGGVLAFAHERQNRRKRSISFAPPELLESSATKGPNNTTEKSLLSRSLTDESLDDPTAVPPGRKRHGKGAYLRGSKSLSGTPPTAEEGAQVLTFEKAVANSGTFVPQQNGIVGHVDGTTFDPEIFKYLTQRYTPMTSLEDRISSDTIQDFLASFDENAIQAERAGLYRLAQTWRIVGYIVGLEASAAVTEQVNGQDPPAPQKKELEASKLLSPKEKHPNKGKSLLFKGVMGSQSQKPHSAHDAENWSNVTTPLAKPLPDSPIDTGEISESQSTGWDEDLDSIRHLPPTVLPPSSSVFSSRKPESPPDMTHDAVIAPVTRGRVQSDDEADTPRGRSLSPPNARERESVPKDLTAETQRSRPRAIAGRADWRLRNDNDREGSAILDEDYDQKEEEKRAALRDYKNAPKKILCLDPVNQDPTRPVTYTRHDSSESFPMFSASTDSSQRTKSLPDGYSPRTKPGLSRKDSSALSGTGESPLEDIPELDIGSPPSSYGRKLSHQPTEEDNSLEGFSLSSTNNAHLERPSRPLPFLAETLVSDSHTNLDAVQNAQPASGATKGNSRFAEPKMLSQSGNRAIVLPITPAPCKSKPWSAQTVIQETIRYFLGNSAVDIVTAVHLLHKVHILFSSCDDILPYQERELIFKMYNDLLLKHEMHVEAAEVRRLCAPAYPSVYDYAQKDTFINVFCHECNKPYENPTRDNQRCHRCNVSQPPCSICMSQDPPEEWISSFSSAGYTATSNSSNSPTSSSCPSPTEGPKQSPPALSPRDTPFAADPTTQDPDPAPSTPGKIHRPHGAALWSWCQGCGHGAHAACLATWLDEISISEGGCATPGCLHDCGPGPRREKHRAARVEANRRARDALPGRKASLAFAKRDSWAAGESRAVERVRGMLGVAGSGSGQSTSTAASNSTSNAGSTGAGVVSPKKVRLVTPGEEDP